MPLTMDWKALQDNRSPYKKHRNNKKPKKYKSTEKLSPEILAEFQKHYQLGAPVPDSIIKEIKIYTRSFKATSKKQEGIKILKTKLLIKKRENKLRNNPTPAETKLHNALQSIFPDIVFQYGIPVKGHFYIADFYHPLTKIAIEVDGSYHRLQEQLISDKERDKRLKKQGIKTLRFTNEDIFTQLPYVVNTITKTIKRRRVISMRIKQKPRFQGIAPANWIKANPEQGKSELGKMPPFLNIAI